jgi:hypothetical protein
VEAVTGQGVMETYRCVDKLCLFVASVANSDRSRCTGQDGINAAVAVMLSSPFRGPYGWRSAEFQVLCVQLWVVNVFYCCHSILSVNCVCLISSSVLG